MPIKYFISPNKSIRIKTAFPCMQMNCAGTLFFVLPNPSIKALLTLSELSNIQLKMYITHGELDSTFDASTGQGSAYEGFHTKGYIFKNGEVFRIIVGSSNMTQAVLTKNKEWNTRIVSTEEGEYVKHMLNEYEELWNSPNAKDFEEFYEDYKTKYELIKEQKKLALEEGKQTKVVDSEKYKLEPNSMHVNFVSNLKKIWKSGEDRALLISSTGRTTYNNVKGRKPRKHKGFQKSP